MSQKQRVGGIVVKTLYKLYQLFGYKFVYYSLYLVVLYYFLFARNVRSALKIYYKKVGITFSNKIFFQHLFNYAITTSDRFISKSNPELYQIENSKRKTLLKEINSGSILLLNHFGGWATAINYFNYNNTKFHIVMSEAMIQSAKEFEDIIQKKNNDSVNIIDLSKGLLHSYITVANALLDNESVALMGDRAIDSKHNKKVDFFKEKASFNKNPFTIAYKTKKPIILIFVIYKDLLKYEVKFHKIELDYDLPVEEAINQSMKEYVKYLSNILIQHPTQWFNFYNFWENK
jgi:predicted LPLAT superfamily acyltransferase